MSTAFSISMSGTQQVPGVVSAASGLGTAVYDSVAHTLDYTIYVTGLDFGPFLGLPAQTATTADDVLDAHFHAAARGVNGGVAFAWASQDTNSLTIVLQGDGSWKIHGLWELTDPAFTPLSAFEALLGSTAVGADMGLYANLHTVTNPSGELRGQLVGMATDGADTVTGTSGNDLLYGLAGNDVMSGGAGNDTLNGGGGTDTADYGSALSALTATVSGGNGTVTGGLDIGSDTLTSIEKIIGSSFNDNFFADSAETINGGAGVNTLYELSSGATIALNSAQYQNIQVVSLYTGVVGGTINGSASTEFNTFYGAASGTSTITTGAFGGWLIAEGGTNVLNGGANAAHGDIFVGTLGTSTMNGGLGTNYYYAGAGDTVLGQANAVLNYEIALQANMNVNLNAGNLTVVALTGGGVASADATGVTKFVTLYGGAAGTFTLTTGTGGGYMIGLGGTAIENGHAQANNSDIFVGGNGTAATMNGGNGLNYYYIDGNDIVHGSGQVNRVIALTNDQSYTVSANFSNVQQIDLLGGTNTVDLTAQVGYIYVFGGAGADTIVAGGAGSGGNEIFTGRGGANTFKFSNGWGTDAIQDWSAGAGNHIDFTSLAAQGVHTIADLQITTSGGNTTIMHAGHGNGTDTLILNGYAAGLNASNFVFA
jgi:hypothetical protein